MNRSATLALLGIGVTLAVSAAQSDELDASLIAYQERMADTAALPQDPQPPTRIRPADPRAGLPERQALMTQPAVADHPDAADLLSAIPDPSEAPQVFQMRLKRLEDASNDQRVINNYRRVTTEALALIKALERAKQVRLSLGECIQRALEHNYTIRIESYNPAISQSTIVEAEAAFDAVFFLNGSWAHLDQPSASQLNATKSDQRDYRGGIRQLLPTGMVVQTSIGQTRRFTDLQFQTLNPSYSTNFVAEFQQPLLRGFGLDFNRAQINLARADRNIAHSRFLQNVRDTLLNVETAYWRLAQTRRTVTILAEQVAQNYATYTAMYERQGHDATPVELANSEARWRSRYVEFLENVKLVKDAEDALKNLLNDQALKLSDELEILPTETPFTLPLTLDHFAEVRTALDRREEIEQARLNIERARIQTGVAKNNTLPRLDLTFQYVVDGLGVSADSSLDRLTTNRFRSYTVGVTFEYPIGNRGPEAALRRARLQESQAVVGLHAATDSVVQQVNEAVRTLMVRYTQIPPQFNAVKASALNLAALQARTQRIDPSYLETELSGVEQLAGNRRTLLGVILDYNIALVELERAKGTLLQYNNVVVSDEPPPF